MNRPLKFLSFLASILALTLVAAGQVTAQQTVPSLAAGADAASATLSARRNAEETANQAFGLGTQDYWISATQFAALVPTRQWSHFGFSYFANNDPGGLAAVYEAQVELPAGARIMMLECLFFDTNASVNGSVEFTKHDYNYVTDVPGSSIIMNVSSSGSNGYQKPSQAVNETIKYRDGDNLNSYALLAIMPANTNVRLRGCRFLWNRQVSPAPASATFADVPASHPFFQFVEALVAAGITVGCGGGNYCPNDPLTRGQMAVFLSRLVGLHFPY